MSVDLLRPYVSEGDGVIDLGANTGEYTKALASMVGPSGHVLAVEPDRETAATLAGKFAAMPWVEVWALAVAGPMDELLALCLDVDDRRRNSLWESNVLKPSVPIEVLTTTIDECAAALNNPRLIKMDIQGAESHALDGAQETLAKGLVWYVELWPQGLKNAGRSVDELAAQFQAHGYELVDPKGRTWAQMLDQIRDWDGHKSTDVVLKKC